MTCKLPGWMSLVCMFGLATNATADSWDLPKETSHLSSDGRWRITVTPRQLSGQLEYFQDKVAGKESAGGLPGGNHSARGHLERRTGKGWSSVWRGNLLNDVAPVDVLVTTNGQVATLDNWHTMGHGDNVVVLYDAAGASVCSLTLHDLFPAVVAENFPRSVSSVWWRDKLRFSEAERVLLLTIASPAPRQMKDGVLDMLGETVELGLRMKDCSVLPPSKAAWAAVLAAAEQSAAEAKQERAEWRAQFVAPLNAPNGDDAEAWDLYLTRAWDRVTPKQDKDYSRQHYLVRQGHADHEASVADLRKELSLLTQWSDLLVVSAAIPAELIGILHEFAASVPPDALRSKRVGLVLATKDFTAARDALRPTEATLIQIDPTVSLPQSEENLRWLEGSEQERANEIAQREQRASGRKAWWLEY